jgi:hypothetical protein
VLQSLHRCRPNPGGLRSLAAVILMIKNHSQTPHAEIVEERGVGIADCGMVRSALVARFGVRGFQMRNPQSEIRNSDS